MNIVELFSRAKRLKQAASAKVGEEMHSVVHLPITMCNSLYNGDKSDEKFGKNLAY